MKLNSSQQIAEQKIRAFRRTDPAAAAAYALRFFGTCPMCGSTIRLPEEDIVTSIRHVHCQRCGWSAEITESQWRSAPEYGLKPACALALAEKAASRSATAPDFAPRSPERSASPVAAATPQAKAEGHVGGGCGAPGATPKREKAPLQEGRLVEGRLEKGVATGGRDRESAAD